MAKQEGKVIKQKLLLVTNFCHFPETKQSENINMPANVLIRTTYSENLYLIY